MVHSTGTRPFPNTLSTSNGTETNAPPPPALSMTLLNLWIELRLMERLQHWRRATLAQGSWRGTAAGARLLTRSVERPFEVEDEILRVLEPDGQAQQVCRRGALWPLDARPVLNQALDATQRRGALPQPEPGDEREGARCAALHAQREHAAESALHLARRDPMARKSRQAGVEDLLYSRVALKMLRDPLGAPALRGNPDEERPHAAQQQPGLEGPEDRPRLGAHGLDPLPGVVLGARRDRARDHVGGAVQGLRGGMHHEIRAEGERAGVDRCREGRVDGEDSARAVRNQRERRYVGDRERRVGWRLYPDEPCLPGTHRCRDAGGFRHVHLLDAKAPIGGPAGEPVAQGPVDDAGHEHVIARPQR